MARSRFGEWRDCLYHAQNRTAHRGSAASGLADYLASLPANDNANAYIFPNAVTHKHTGSLSNQFREILVEAGLVEPQPWGHRSTGKGRTGPRTVSEISFHSLRHSAVTMLKA